MIKVEKVQVYNFDGAIRGMRNPLESWAQSDSRFEGSEFVMGEKDYALALRLIKAGTDHSKFTRQIFISMDITAPLYFYKEFDTYKVGTVANSTSTMHKLGSRDLTAADFSFDVTTPFFEQYITHINGLINEWRDNKNEQTFRAMVQNLLDSFNQTRTVSLNYAVARSMFCARLNHKLSEWREFCAELAKLPYSKLITEYILNDDNHE